MVWGSITVAGRTDLHVVAGRVTWQYYRENILAHHVVPFARRYGRRFIFQDDNARCHRARIVTDYLQQQNITTYHGPHSVRTFPPSSMSGTCLDSGYANNLLPMSKNLLQHCNRNGITFPKMTWNVSLEVCHAGSELVWPTEGVLPAPDSVSQWW